MDLEIPIESGPPELPEAYSYHARLSALEKERTYRVRSGQFSILEEGRSPQSFPLSDFVELRLRFQPTRMQTNRFECLLKTKSGQRLKIGNEYYRGLADFEDRSASYRDWIHHLVREVGFHAPQCRMVTGCPPPLWWGYLLMLVAVFGVLIALIVVFAMAVPVVALAKVVFIIVMTPLAINWFRLNRERSFNATEAPEKVLPK